MDQKMIPHFSKGSFHGMRKRFLAGQVILEKALSLVKSSLNKVGITFDIRLCRLRNFEYDYVVFEISRFGEFASNLKAIIRVRLRIFLRPQFLVHRLARKARKLIPQIKNPLPTNHPLVLV